MIVYYLSLVSMMSIFSFILYGVDKNRAIRGKYRIKEGKLLTISIFFGAFGGLLSMYLFRHKIRKWYFILINWFSLIIHLGILYFIWNNSL
jgi:uncharacterized membrane protein YsdA (DUF1294 family)